MPSGARATCDDLGRMGTPPDKFISEEEGLSKASALPLSTWIGDCRHKSRRPRPELRPRRANRIECLRQPRNPRRPISRRRPPRLPRQRRRLRRQLRARRHLQHHRQPKTTTPAVRPATVQASRCFDRAVLVGITSGIEMNLCIYWWCWIGAVTPKILFADSLNYGGVSWAHDLSVRA